MNVAVTREKGKGKKRVFFDCRGQRFLSKVHIMIKPDGKPNTWRGTLFSYGSRYLYSQ